MLFTTSVPKRAFVEVGVLTSSHGSSYSSSNEVELMMGLRTKAAEVGCDGVVVTKETNVETAHLSPGSKPGAVVQVDTVQKKLFRASCIVFNDGVATAQGEP
jgi:hypothetical protein